MNRLSFPLAALLAIPAAFPAAGKTSVPQAVEGNTAFAIDLYHRESRKEGNLFFSPYSISTALAMTYAGARAGTALEMARTLHFPGAQDDLAPAFAGLADRFKQVQKGGQAQLSVANSLWCQRHHPFLPAFLELNRNYYRAEVRAVDFAGNADGARREINDWVAQQTQDKIRDLLRPPVPSPAARLVLCNAIYFKGNWLAQFDPKLTQPAPFLTAPNRNVPVPMMTRKLKLRIHSVAGLRLGALPYTGNDLSLVILLPDATDGLPSLERQLTAANLLAWLKALDAEAEVEIPLFLPKFKLNCRLDLAKDLAAMGMPAAFAGGADFSGMDGARDLFISDVVHQAFVEVNEQGTEAAAATAVVMTKGLALRPTPVFRVDHPFLFLIRDNQTGSLLFLGRVTNPAD
jgi:serine protease inhibitor